MKIIALGGAGKICREAVLDLVQFSSFDQLTIADYDERAASELANKINSDKVDSCFIDITNENKAVELLSNYDIVMDGTTISLNDISTRCIAKAKCHGINLNGFGEEYKYNEMFRENGKIHIPGFGMTPGTTNMMAVWASDKMDTVDSVRCSHGAFRPIAFSPSIAETTIYEYNPELQGRVVYENGKLIQVPPFARPRMIELPEPYGTQEQYIIPHSETLTLPQYLKEKGVKLVEVRGTWPSENMQLVKALYNYGFLENPEVEINGSKVRIMDAVGAFLCSSEKGQNTKLYGYALHVEVIGHIDGERIRYVLTHTHPTSDGTVPEWEGLRSYTRCVGIPMAIGVDLIAKGKYKDTGVVIPEFAFEPDNLFKELEKRKIFIHVKSDVLEPALI